MEKGEHPSRARKQAVSVSSSNERDDEIALPMAYLITFTCWSPISERSSF
jgi:hypothetical protein